MQYDKKEESKVTQKKRKKESQLFDAAYELFTTKGTNNTAIDDIVKKAGVAKGTFYLYFKDKYDIINRLILKKSSVIVKEAVKELESKNIQDFNEKVLFFIDYLIEYFKKNKLLLKLINKNFSWGLFRRSLRRKEEDNNVEEVSRFFIDNLLKKDVDNEEAIITLFLVFELIGSVCYSSIILEEPMEIDKIKPILYKKVLKIIE